jgi:hypothetical protein
LHHYPFWHPGARIHYPVRIQTFLRLQIKSCMCGPPSRRKWDSQVPQPRCFKSFSSFLNMGKLRSSFCKHRLLDFDLKDRLFWLYISVYFLSYSIQNGSGAHPASYPMGTGGLFPWG